MTYFIRRSEYRAAQREASRSVIGLGMDAFVVLACVWMAGWLLVDGLHDFIDVLALVLTVLTGLYFAFFALPEDIESRKKAKVLIEEYEDRIRVEDQWREN